MSAFGSFMSGLGQSGAQGILGGAINFGFNKIAQNQAMAKQQQYWKEQFAMQNARQDFLLNNQQEMQANSYRKAGLSLAALSGQFSNPVTAGSGGSPLSGGFNAGVNIDAIGAANTISNTRLQNAEADKAETEAKYWDALMQGNLGLLGANYANIKAQTNKYIQDAGVSSELREQYETFNKHYEELLENTLKTQKKTLDQIDAQIENIWSDTFKNDADRKVMLTMLPINIREAFSRMNLNSANAKQAVAAAGKFAQETKNLAQDYGIKQEAMPAIIGSYQAALEKVQAETKNVTMETKLKTLEGVLKQYDINTLPPETLAKICNSIDQVSATVYDAAEATSNVMEAAVDVASGGVTTKVPSAAAPKPKPVRGFGRR